jgi:AraC-like DNA-binding protein
VEMSAHVQQRSRSHRGDGPRCRGQDQRLYRSHPVPSAVLPRGHILLLRDPSTDGSASSAVASRLQSIQPCTAVSDAHQRPRIPGRIEPVRSGLAAWQQVVLVAYIEKHIGESLTIRALARFVYLSSDCFCRGFKKSFGMTPHRYLVQRRIERAKALLARSAWSITSIGLALGFSQTTSFSAAFQRATGMTPTEFRQARR